MSELLSDQQTPVKRGVLLTIVCCLLALGVGTSLILSMSDVAAKIGTTYQLLLIASALITAVAAYGIWQLRKWGAYVYIALVIVNQPFLMLMGWWNLGSLLLPGVVVLILVLKLGKMR